MSGMLMERAIQLKTPLSHAAMRVLMLLAKHADDDGTNCFPSMQTIEDIGQMSRGTVVRCLEQLADAGLILSEHRKGRNGNTYLLQIPLQTVAPSDRSPPSKRSDHRTVNGPEQSHDRTVPNGPMVGPKQPVNGPMVDINGPIIGPDSIKTLSKKERTPLTGGSAPAPAPARIVPDPRGSRLPQDWQPLSELQEFAAKLGLDPAAIADRFRDHWHGQAGAKARKADWPATWRNWCRKDAEDQANRQRPWPQRQTQAEKLRDMLIRAGELPGCVPTIDAAAEQFRPYLVATGD